MINKKSNIIFLLLIFAIATFSSCSSYVGRTVEMSHSSVCDCRTLPKLCTASDGNFIINYTVSRLNETDTFLVEGSATYQGSATWESFSGAFFTLLLVKDDVIVETVSVAGGQGSLSGTIIFKSKFKTENKFEASLILYNMDVKG